MASVTNTVLTTQAIGNREELDNLVSLITPSDTPLYSMAGKTSAASKHPEWEYEDLDTPGENAQPEGNEYNFDEVTPPTRVGNYTQIFRKSYSFSKSQQAVDNAGPVEKAAHEKMKKGKALRKDIEFSIVDNRASVDGVTRYSGSLPTWLETNTSRGAGGADGGFSGGFTTAVTAGTKRAFTKALTDDILQSIYEQGGNVTTVVTSSYNKRVFATFMSDSNVASFRYAAGKGTNTIVGTADIYESPYGAVKIMPDRVMSEGIADSNNSSNVFFMDPGMVKWAALRKIQEAEVAKTGDAEKGIIIGEGCLKVLNEKGIGVIADTFGLTATT